MLFPPSISVSSQAPVAQPTPPSPEHKEQFFLLSFIRGLAEGWGMQLQAFCASLFLLDEVIWDLASVTSGSPHALPLLAIGCQRGCGSRSS